MHTGRRLGLYQLRQAARPRPISDGPAPSPSGAGSGRCSLVRPSPSELSLDRGTSHGAPGSYRASGLSYCHGPAVAPAPGGPRRGPHCGRRRLLRLSTAAGGRPGLQVLTLQPVPKAYRKCCVKCKMKCSHLNRLRECYSRLYTGTLKTDGRVS